MISKGNLGDLRDSWHLPPWRHFTAPQVLHLQGMITHFFSFLDKYKIYKKYLSFFFQVWILAPDGPHVLPWTRPSVRSKNLYFTSISRHICLKIITGLIKPCIFWNQTWLLSRPDGHLDFCTVYPWCCLKENIYTHHFISRTFLGQFGLVFCLFAFLPR